MGNRWSIATLGVLWVALGCGTDSEGSPADADAGGANGSGGAPSGGVVNGGAPSGGASSGTSGTSTGAQPSGGALSTGGGSGASSGGRSGGSTSTDGGGPVGGGSAGQPGAGDAGAQSQGGAGGGEGGAGTGEAGSGEAGQGQAGQASGGEGPTCGGFIGAVCEEDQWCDYPDDGLCGNADATGTCRARPEVCTRDCPGVCGCDGRFYCNACTANNLGVDVSQETDCPEAGGLGALCTSDAECEVGLSCCYPCGRAGCQNECMDVANGNCPLLP